MSNFNTIPPSQAPNCSYSPGGGQSYPGYTAQLANTFTSTDVIIAPVPAYKSYTKSNGNTLYVLEFTMSLLVSQPPCVTFYGISPLNGDYAFTAAVFYIVTDSTSNHHYLPNADVTYTYYKFVLAGLCTVPNGAINCVYAQYVDPIPTTSPVNGDVTFDPPPGPGNVPTTKRGTVIIVPQT